MKKTFPLSYEFIYQLVALMLIIIAVHAVYAGLVRPRAEAVLAQQAAMAAEEAPPVVKRSLYVVISDYEQEICFILLLWALAIMAYKAVIIARNRNLLYNDLLPVAEGERILPEDTRRLSRQIQALPPQQRRSLLPRVLLVGLERFNATRNIQDVANTTRAYCAAEGERLESELSMLRYIAWAIPSIGFIGTVRGIGDALGLAHQALEGQIFGVTRSLGTAFNSTFVALVLSIILMFMLYQLQLLQERYVLETEAYCEERLTQHLYS